MFFFQKGGNFLRNKKLNNLKLHGLFFECTECCYDFYVLKFFCFYSFYYFYVIKHQNMTHRWIWLGHAKSEPVILHSSDLTSNHLYINWVHYSGRNLFLKKSVEADHQWSDCSHKDVHPNIMESYFREG